MSVKSQTHVLIISSKLTTQLFDDDILQPITLQFLFRRPGLIFQHDNGRPHAARVAMNFHQACPILPWIAWLPDLSPIDHIWDVMRRRLLPSQNTDDLDKELQTIWHEILQDTIK